MRGRRPVGHIADLRNMRMEETSRRQRRMEASSEGSHGPNGALVPYREWNGKILRNKLTPQFQPFRYQQKDQT
jgi:hypothetical protein